MVPRPVPGVRQDLRRSLQRITFRQAGYVTAAQAKELGYSYQAQKYHVDHGNWIRVDRGLFRLPDWPAEPDDVYVRWTLWSAGRAVVSHATALRLHELSDVDPALVHLTVPPGFRARDDAVVLHPAALDEADVESRAGYRVTTAQRTLLDAAAGDLSQEHVDTAIAEAIQRGLTTARTLRERADEAGDRAALRVERALALRAPG